MKFEVHMAPKGAVRMSQVWEGYICRGVNRGVKVLPSAPVDRFSALDLWVYESKPGTAQMVNTGKLVRHHQLSQRRCRPDLDWNDLSDEEYNTALWFQQGYRKQGEIDTGTWCRQPALSHFTTNFVELMDALVEGLRLPKVPYGNEFVLRAMANFHRAELGRPPLALPRDPRPLPRRKLFTDGAPRATSYDF